MKIIIVTYDLISPGKNYESLLSKLRAYETWAKLGGSAYLIGTKQDVVSVRDNLAQVLDKNDKLFVSVCPPPAAWQGLPDDVGRWILANQPQHSMS